MASLFNRYRISIMIFKMKHKPVFDTHTGKSNLKAILSCKFNGIPKIIVTIIIKNHPFS